MRVAAGALGSPTRPCEVSLGPGWRHQGRGRQGMPNYRARSSGVGWTERWTQETWVRIPAQPQKSHNGWCGCAGRTAPCLENTPQVGSGATHFQGSHLDHELPASHLCSPLFLHPLPMPGRLYNDLGLHYAEMGLFWPAEQFFQEALKLCSREEASTQERAVLLQNLGAVYNALEQAERALRFHSEAADIYGGWCLFCCSSGTGWVARRHGGSEHSPLPSRVVAGAWMDSHAHTSGPERGQSTEFSCIPNSTLNGLGLLYSWSGSM